MTFDREKFANAIDGAILHLMTIRDVLAEVGDEPEPGYPEGDWRGPCPDREGRAHDMVWVPDATFQQEHREQGVCRACGLEAERAAPE